MDKAVADNVICLSDREHHSDSGRGCVLYLEIKSRKNNL